MHPVVRLQNFEMHNIYITDPMGHFNVHIPSNIHVSSVML